MSCRDPTVKKQPKNLATALIVSKPTHARPPHPTKSLGPAKNNTISASII